MGLLNPLGFLLLGLCVPIILLHILRPRREAVEVSSTYLWQNLEEPVAAATPWQRLKPNLLLLLQLLAVLLLTLVVVHPVRSSPSPLARHTVFIIDASGSMAAVDGGPDRLAEAKKKAIDLRKQLPPDGRASIVVAGETARVALNASPEKSLFEDALGPISTIAAPADFVSAFGLAEGLAERDGDTGFVLLSDGGMSAEARTLIPAGTRYEVVGELSENRAISRLTVEPTDQGNKAFVVVRNTGDTRVTQDLRIDVDGVTVETVEVTIEPGESYDHEASLPVGDEVSAFLDGDDLLAIDNRAYALAPRREPIRVLRVGPDNFFLDALFDSREDVEVVKASVSEPGEGFDLVIYDRVPIPEDPGAPLIAIAPPSGLPGVTVTGEVELPVPTFVGGEDSLLVDLDFSTVSFAKAQQINAGDAEVLIADEETPMLLRGTYAGDAFIYFAFELFDTDLVVTPTFPQLAGRMVDQLTGEFDPSTQLLVGERVPVRAGIADAVVAPGEVRTPITLSSPPPVADKPGYWRIENDGETVGILAVNPDTGESALKPAAELPIDEPPEGSGVVRANSESSLRHWVIYALLAVLLAEFLVSRRQVGVPVWQRRTATVGRALAAGLLVLGLLGLSLSRPADDVATVFLVDQSDSLGEQGRRDALDWVRDALNERPGDASSAVVLFGGDSRVEVPLGSDDLGTPRVVVDATQTDLAGGLRLAGAVLPSNSRRRIVLVSDGRPTRGDALVEAQTLAERGVQVDVHTVSGSDGPDAAVSSVDAPNVAREGEEVKIIAVVESNEAGQATLVLKQADEVIETRNVELDEGRNEFEFTDVADETGLARYEVSVELPGDSISENDAAFTAVQGADSARVLLVEGTDGEGEVLEDALGAAGVIVDTVSPGELPSLDELSTYSSTVLVNVDARSLSATALGDLGTATRDLGKGLVTIGGPRSYGPGGYLNTELEELLPVVSEVTDPERRKSVAQVLAIDTSESMGACHCADGNAGFGDNSFDGGVNKTDISRAAAQRAVEVMASTDEIGVVAFDDRARWVIDLQADPSDDLVRRGLNSLRPAGGTDLSDSLRVSAEQLRASDASIKHIVLFTDGFTEPTDMADLTNQAAELFEEGITVSVVGTGEGTARELEDIAEAGGGRFYPGRDLEEVPEIIVQETFVASRNFINEGDYLPEVTSSISAPVRGLDTAPTLGGFVATTAKDAALTSMRIGEEKDPLLSTWQVGLGKSTAWTSDATVRWSQNWANWDGFVEFWSTVVKDTFPLNQGATVSARAEDGRISIVLEADEAIDTGATATARVTGPNGEAIEVPLERVNGTTFEGVAEAGEPGSYAVGASVSDADGSIVAGASSLASQSYSAEYKPGRSDPELLLLMSEATGGRGEITFAQAFDPADLERGTRKWSFVPWLIAAAIVLWLLSAILNRLALVKPAGAEDTSWRSLATSAVAERRAQRAQRKAPKPGWSRETPPVPGSPPTQSPPTGPPTAPPASSLSGPQFQPPPEPPAPPSAARPTQPPPPPPPPPGGGFAPPT